MQSNEEQRMEEGLFPAFRSIGRSRTIGRRGTTLTKPERAHTKTPLLRGATTKKNLLLDSRAKDGAELDNRFDLWAWSAKIATCCIPSCCLSFCKVKGPGPQQAWREKVTLCLIALFICGFVIFFVVGLNQILCPTGSSSNVSLNVFNGIMVDGNMYDVTTGNDEVQERARIVAGSDTIAGVDMSSQFSQGAIPACARLNSNEYFFANIDRPCVENNNCLYLATSGLQKYTSLTDGTKLNPVISYSWDDIKANNFIYFNSAVLNLTGYFTAAQEAGISSNDPVHKVLLEAQNQPDASYLISSSESIGLNKDARDCLVSRYYAGRLNSDSPSCTVSFIFSLMVAILVLAILSIRFLFAVLFAWFFSRSLSKRPNNFKTAEELAPLYAAESRGKRDIKANLPFRAITGTPEIVYAPTHHTPEDIGLELYTILLITCYSEGEESLRTTMESMALTDYADSRKCLFVIADGLITGKGNAKSTPDLLLDMVEVDPAFGTNPKAYSYVAVASGSKGHNMCRVYVGHFVHAGRRVPTVICIKCGTPDEVDEPKPGNRGKRDSQLILMNFFARVTLNDRMTPLDFDLFRKFRYIMGVTPDFFEVVLMVDADTRVMPDCLQLMINAMHNDPLVMGLCGETRISNKVQSWVTMIQVFEYYISHHLGKAFESMFGGVTCLPGCFCMYRIKGRKDDGWVPVLVNPDIVETYSTNEVQTLHQKNLLLLGEDRFLTTLMLRTFPNRKMVFIPQAVCKTVVPDDFKTLLSQRRRWINSTIHNLMELVLVQNLCGTFCFSMQFVVLIDVISTAALPASIISTIYLVVSFIVNSGSMSTASYINVGTLCFVLFFPSFIVIASFKRYHYLFWMLIYMLSLIIWNLVLPVYAMWHFDDFSWGATRQVTGAKGGKDDHGSGGEFDGTKVTFKRWEDYERAWRKSMAVKLARGGN